MNVVRICTGGLFVSRDPVTVTTVLGSCVAACLYDPVAGIGGMNHFMLPDGAEADTPARYGVHAMELLINAIMSRGGDRFRLLAKAFGAAHVIGTPAGLLSVPDRNASFVRRFLSTERIPLVSFRLGGSHPLEVHFHPRDGRARIRPIDAAGDDVMRREAGFLEGLRRPRSGEVTLF